jgi:hypothetical protein
MIRGDPTLEECLELLQARSGRGFVEISQAIAQVEERYVAANGHPSAQCFLEIQSVAQAGFHRWVDRAIADLCILLSAGNLDRMAVSRMAADELGTFAEKIRDATKAESFRDVVNAQSIGAERRKFALLLTAKLRRFEMGVLELPKVKIEVPAIKDTKTRTRGSHRLARGRMNGSCQLA